MSDLDLRSHWENVYRAKSQHGVSWFEVSPTVSLDLIHATGVKADESIIDIGGGASRLAHALLDEGFEAVTVLDHSGKALGISETRLGSRSAKVRWIAVDVTAWEPPLTYDVWHDRPALHFLTGQKEPLALPTFGREIAEFGIQKVKKKDGVRYVGIALRSDADFEEDKKLTALRAEAA